MTQDKVFALLFADNDYICYGDEFATKVRPMPSKSLQEPFYCINPLDPLVDYVKSPDGAIKPFRNGGRRSDLNVTKLRNFLFEIDSMPLANQLAIFEQLKPYVASIVFSGGKSYHAIVSLVEPLEGSHTTEGVQRYKDVWHGLATAFERIVGVPELFDRACQNPSRLSRTPGGMRDQVEQSIVYIGSMLQTSQLSQLVALDRVGLRRQTVHATYDTEPLDEQETLKRMPSELHYQLKYPSYWSSGMGHGNYPEIFRLCLWLIDSTGANRQLVHQIFNRLTVDHLVQNGYPRERISKAIEDACNFKELV